MTQQESQFEKLMTECGVEVALAAGRIDYYLPEYDLLVELKTWETDRLMDQLRSVSGKSILVLVGPNSVAAFASLLRSRWNQ